MIQANHPYIIGETAYHHEGELDFLFELINQASTLGLSAIKFHSLLEINDYFVHDHEALPIIEKISLSRDDLKKAIEMSNQLKLDVIVLCNDVASLNWIIENKIAVKAIEIHATGLNDIFILNEASKFSGSVILGIGGSTLDEVKFAVDFLKEKGQNDIILMHGFQNYPTEYADIFLERIEKVGKLFNLPMGYADHTDPLNENNEWISVLGLTKGAYIIEKHFTTKFGEKRIDAQAAVSIDQMKKIKEYSLILYQSLGLANPLGVSIAELKYGDTGPMKKAPVARMNISKGETITLDKIAFKRTMKSSTIQQKDILKIIGLKAKEDIDMDEQIDYSKIEFKFIVADISQFKNTKK